MPNYTQAQLENLLGIGKWWSINTAAARLGNISKENLRKLLFSFPTGIDGIAIQKSEIFKGNEDFMFVGTREQKIERLQHSRTRLKFDLRKPQAQCHPVIMRSIREKISEIDKQLRELKQEA